MIWIVILVVTAAAAVFYAGMCVEGALIGRDLKRRARR